MIRYRADTEKWAPIAVECAVRGWPEVDADGQTQFENTHFDTENEARIKLLSEANAVVSIETREVKRLRAKLVNAEKHLVDAVLIRASLCVGKRDPVNECPGPDCKLCNGEACDLCGAGKTGFHGRCEHDVLQRHQEPPHA